MPLTLREAIARTLPRVREDAVVEARAELLPAADRDLVLTVWTYQQPTRMVAEMYGISPRVLRRRARSLIDRLHSDEFIGAARAMRLLGDAHAELAKLHFCHGLSVRQAARAMGVGYHKARQMAAEIRGLIGGLRDLRAESDPAQRRASSRVSGKRSRGR